MRARLLTSEFAARLTSGATTTCLCWRLARGDGFVLAATEHDRALEVDGVTYSPGGALEAGAFTQGADLAPGQAAAGGVLADDAITEAELVAPEMWRLSGLLRGQQGSVSAAAAVGARVLLLDGSEAVATLSAGEIGIDLAWRAAGREEGETLASADEGGRPWPVCHLRAAGGILRWVRRGGDLPESWALPEGANAGRFAVAFDTGGGFGAAVEVDLPEIAIPAGAAAALVAEIGADGRRGKWVSISLATP